MDSTRCDDTSSTPHDATSDNTVQQNGSVGPKGSPLERLARNHRWQVLAESGISEKVAESRGYSTVTEKRDLERLGFSSIQRRVPALVIPRWSPTGEQIPPQAKPDEPRTNGKGKPVKYETPYGSKIGLSVHPSQMESMRNKSVRLWVTEGDKKGDSLASRGECVVVLQGVECWQRDRAPLPEWEDIKLQGREVIVVFDSDVATNPRVQDALKRLTGFLDGRGAVVKIVRLPPGSGGVKVGVDDYLVGGQSIEEVLALVEAEEERKAYAQTDTGNAERLVDRHGRDLGYVHPWGRFIVYDGTRWRVDDTGEVRRRGKDTVRGIYREAEDAPDDARRKAVAQHAIRSESKNRIDAMIDLGKDEVPVTPAQLDADPWKLNVLNGTVDLKTGEKLLHSRADLITKIAPVEYDPDATAPVFEEFLEKVLPSEALRKFVQRAIGYSLTGDVSEQALLFLYGTGANGKTTLLNVMHDISGGYGKQAAPDLLVAKGTTHPTELADLFGARFVASVEVEDGRRLAESLVKQLTGGDRIKARYMRQDFWEFDPTHKVWLAANHKPEVRGTDFAIWRRIKLIPFGVTIAKKDQDPKLPEKLKDELPGILAWAVRGCLEWQRDGLGEPKEVTQATEGYKVEQDVLAAFLVECCWVDQDARAKFKDLWATYQNWCKEAGEDPGTKMKFGKRLDERGFENRRGNRNVALRAGLGLLDEEAMC